MTVVVLVRRSFLVLVALTTSPSDITMNGKRHSSRRKDSNLHLHESFSWKTQVCKWTAGSRARGFQPSSSLPIFGFGKFGRQTKHDSQTQSECEDNLAVATATHIQSNAAQNKLASLAKCCFIFPFCCFEIDAHLGCYSPSELKRICISLYIHCTKGPDVRGKISSLSTWVDSNDFCVLRLKFHEFCLKFGHSELWWTPTA